MINDLLSVYLSLNFYIYSGCDDVLLRIHSRAVRGTRRAYTILLSELEFVFYHLSTSLRQLLNISSHSGIFNHERESLLGKVEVKLLRLVLASQIGIARYAQRGVLS
jgi:hypothetical protein